VRRKCKCQDHWWGYPEEFEESPLGASLRAQATTMVANGQAAQMMLYEYDFVEGQPHLNLRGLDQLVKMAHLLAINPAPLVIERTPCYPGLAEARRVAILNELSHGNCPVPPERVVIGPSLTRGLTGPEADLEYRNFLFRVRQESARPIVLPTVGFGLGAAIIGGSANAPSGGPGVGGGLGGPGGLGGTEGR
jgi:hypothetical protein